MHRRIAFILSAALLCLTLGGPGSVIADSPEPADRGAAATMILPPELPWDGASRGLIAPPDDPWITPAEASGFRFTPSYVDTMAYIRRIEAMSPMVTVVSLGVSPEGRDIQMVVVSADGGATPAALRASGKPTLLAQAGIHSGEIDGKDAGLMLLRDMTVKGTERQLLEGANFLFVPIFNVDGHERSSPFSRMNQRGPEEMGWRTTSRNLNLNRDYAKLDTPEMKALVATLNRWQPDLYLDLHVTDGADYQYDITYGYNGRHAWSPAGAAWLEEVLAPALDTDLTAAGHIPGPLVFLVDGRDPSKGNAGWTATPRFSNGYGDARQLPTVLVENHSLKPYEQRVLGTYVLLETSMRTLGADAETLREAIAADRARRPAEVPLAFKVPEGEPPRISFKGVELERTPSDISGADKPVWTGQPIALTIPWFQPTEPALTVSRPAAYWLHPAWKEVIDRLLAHGVQVEWISEATEVEVEAYRLEEAKLDPRPFEGHVRVSAQPRAEQLTLTYPAGSVRVPTDQPLGTLAILLLEPAAPDSFFQWGFFLEVLQRTEYFEAYVMEAMAAAMLAEDPELAAEFERALEDDPELAGNPRARLEWFYRRTPFLDQRWLLYPVARELPPPPEEG